MAPTAQQPAQEISGASAQISIDAGQGVSVINLGKPRNKETVKKGDNVTLGGRGVTPSTFF